MIEVGMSYSELEEETSFKPLAKGKYKVQVEECTLETAKSGKAMVKWVLKTVDNEDNSHNGRLLTDYTVLPSEYGPDELAKDGKPISFYMAKKLGEVIKALTPDWTPDSNDSIQFDEEDLSPWIGRECNAAVVQDEYEGNINNKIGRLLPL